MPPFVIPTEEESALMLYRFLSTIAIGIEMTRISLRGC